MISAISNQRENPAVTGGRESDTSYTNHGRRSDWIFNANSHQNVRLLIGTGSRLTAWRSESPHVSCPAEFCFYRLNVTQIM